MRPGGCSLADAALKQVNPLQNALCRLLLPLIRLLVLLLQVFQNHLEVHIQMQLPFAPGYRDRFVLLQQLQRHLAVQPGLPGAAGAHLIAERQRQQPK